MGGGPRTRAPSAQQSAAPSGWHRHRNFLPGGNWNRVAGAYLKFFVQAIAGAMLFAGGLRILDLPLLFGSHQFSWITGLPLTILWVMAITNAFNLIDGLDGLAAGSALFSTLVLFVIALMGNL